MYFGNSPAPAVSIHFSHWFEVLISWHSNLSVCLDPNLNLTWLEMEISFPFSIRKYISTNGGGKGYTCYWTRHDVDLNLPHLYRKPFRAPPNKQQGLPTKNSIMLVMAARSTSSISCSKKLHPTRLVDILGKVDETGFVNWNTTGRFCWLVGFQCEQTLPKTVKETNWSLVIQ